MGLLKFINFSTFWEKDVINEHFLDTESDKILNDIDKEFRFREVNELSYPDKEIKTNLVYAATALWKSVVNASNSLYKRLQILEADYSEVKSELDDKLYYELKNHEDERAEVQEVLQNNAQEIEELKKEKKAIEHEFHNLKSERKVKGDLNSTNPLVFWILMLLAAGAELLIYKNVFLSQEIGLKADMQEQQKFWVDIMALVMASGFTIMIVWFAHTFGKMLRYFPNIPKSERLFYYFKFFLISVVVGTAIWATVDIRGQMHTILAKDQEVSDIKNKIFQNENNTFGDTTVTTNTAADDEDGMFGDDEPQESESTAPQKKNPQSNVTQLEQKKEELTNEINFDKGKTAKLFLFINLFIFFGGVFLSYAVHSSSFMYDKIISQLKELDAKRKKLKKELHATDKRIVRFKHNVIDKLFKKLLYRAALYDKEVRTYNTYMQIFELKLQLIEDYIKKIYDEKGIKYSDISYKEVLEEGINIDRRSELQHVNNIDDYMIYHYKKGES